MSTEAVCPEVTLDTTLRYGVEPPSRNRARLVSLGAPSGRSSGNVVCSLQLTVLGRHHRGRR
jgi:hypothetical protein